MLRIITLNLNGIRSATRKGWLEWLAMQRADVVCVQELPEPATMMLMVAFYKSGLSTPAYHGVETFQHVVREYRSFGSAASLGLAHRGDWADVDLEFLEGSLLLDAERLVLPGE